MKNKDFSPVVEIVIRGDIGCGKTTIGQLIQKALIGEGLTNVNITDVSDEKLPTMAYFQSRTKSLRDKNTEFRIKMVELKRDEVIKLHGCK